MAEDGTFKCDASDKKEILRTERVNWIENMDLPEIINYLYSDKIISRREMSTLTSERVPEKQIEQFMNYLEKKPPDIFNKFLGILHQSQPYLIPIQKTNESSSTDLETTIQSSLKALYQSQRKYIPLAPWNEEDFSNIFEMYTPLTLTEQVSVGGGIESKQLSHYQDLLMDKDGKVKIGHYLVTGRAGVGKTTQVTKIVIDWAGSKEFGMFKFVYFITMREVEDNDTLEGYILENLLGDDVKVSPANLRNFIEEHQEESLFILDGYDEFSAKSRDFERILEYKWLRKSCVLLTTRPHMLPPGRWERRAQVTGFSQANQIEYVKRFFAGEPDATVKSFQEMLENVPKLEELCSVPFHLMSLCLIFLETQTLPSSKTMMYKDLFTCLDLRYKSKRNTEDDYDIQNIMEVLGEKIYEKTLQDIVVFELDANELKTKEIQLALKIGLIAPEKIWTKLKTVRHYSFLHKTVQEYCTAAHIISMTKKKDICPDLMSHMDTIEHMYQISEILQFVLGLSTSENISNCILSLLDNCARKCLTRSCKMKKENLMQDMRSIILLELRVLQDSSILPQCLPDLIISKFRRGDTYWMRSFGDWYEKICATPPELVWCQQISMGNEVQQSLNVGILNKEEIKLSELKSLLIDITLYHKPSDWPCWGLEASKLKHLLLNNLDFESEDTETPSELPPLKSLIIRQSFMCLAHRNVQSIRNCITNSVSSLTTLVLWNNDVYRLYIEPGFFQECLPESAIPMNLSALCISLPRCPTLQLPDTFHDQPEDGDKVLKIAAASAKNLKMLMLKHVIYSEHVQFLSQDILLNCMENLKELILLDINFNATDAQMFFEALTQLKVLTNLVLRWSWLNEERISLDDFFQKHCLPASLTEFGLDILETCMTPQDITDITKHILTLPLVSHISLSSRGYIKTKAVPCCKAFFHSTIQAKSRIRISIDMAIAQVLENELQGLKTYSCSEFPPTSHKLPGLYIKRTIFTESLIDDKLVSQTMVLPLLENQ